MDLYLLDKDFMSFDVIDNYISLIWTDRFRDPGEFELYAPMSSDLTKSLRGARFAAIRDSDEIMVIESAEIHADAEEGDTILVKGRTMSSILDRRIVLNKFSEKTTASTAITKILKQEIASPTDSKRIVPNFIVDVKDIGSKTYDFSYENDNLLDAIKEICEKENYGFQVIVENNKLYFRLIVGNDRSYNQNVNPPIIFSPQFDNLLSSNYLESPTTLKNVCYVDGEEDDNGNKKHTVALSTDVEATGYDRRESYLSASIDSKTEDGSTISDSEYLAQLKVKGKEDLAEHKTTKVFDGELVSSDQYKYGRDYFIGDIVSFRNAYDMESTVRITEVTRSYDASGFTVIPVFTSTEEEAK